MSLVSFIGPRPNLLDLEGTAQAQAARSAPADPDQRGSREDPLASAISRTSVRHEDARHHLSASSSGAEGMAAALDAAVRARRKRGARPATTSSSCPTAWSGRTASRFPALLATAAVHHHLIRKGLRTSVGLVVETGEAREVHHFALLAGYGAEAINPYLAFETLAAMAKRPARAEVDGYEVVQALHQVDRQGHAEGHVQDGHLDLSVLLRRADLRRGRPVDELRRRVLHRHGDDDRGRRASPRSPRRRCAGIATPSAIRRSRARRSMSAANTPSASRGEAHVWTPQTVSLLQHAVRGNARETYRGLRQAAQRAERAVADHPRRCSASRRGGRRPRARAARRGRAGRRDRQALLDRRDVATARSRARRTPRSPSP